MRRRLCYCFQEEENCQSLENEHLKTSEHQTYEALIGESSDGSVYRATLNNGKTVALKKLDVPSYRESNARMVSRLNHGNLVELQGYCIEGSLRVLAYEFATMGSLYDILHGAQPGPVLDWMQRLRIALDVARGLEYMHKKVRPPVIHGCIRSSNVLLFQELKVKIADFSLSNQSTDMDACFRSAEAAAYLAPEYAF
ncbi:hypothetical protein PTKIN_Ptkin15bG0030400 [Pterospermum kingtungense]